MVYNSTPYPSPPLLPAVTLAAMTLAAVTLVAGIEKVMFLIRNLIKKALILSAGAGRSRSHGSRSHGSESHGSESHGSGSQDDVLGARGLSKPEILGLTGGGHGRRQVKALVFIEEKLRAA